ncbi:multicopper oxidase MmcO [Kribbella albertanoniae]|uniref:Multicopper oxidase family protein n=1 Tax=Kribbella albertanoniae TaxID=1266829 RepID=A0A4R4QHD1_9ACTN|nr:multicopper oxidase family protein [Kribbella albertanoniae]TDC35024.1 multicopper oxidase family protein [Kribbella albertanoniae]
MSSITRRSVLFAGLGITGAGVLGGCSQPSNNTSTAAPSLLSPSGPEVETVDGARASSGKENHLILTAAATTVDLGAGVIAKTWAFDGRTPGEAIRISAGDTLVAGLSNRLPDQTATSIHWHGVALRNDMDGVPPATQATVAAGDSFTYRFIAPDPGTYFFHPHVGAQLDRGLYAPLVIEDPKEPMSYDDEWIVILDDWIDGVTGTPDEVFAELKQGMAGMSGMAMRFMLGRADSELLGGDAGDVKYPHHLVNGRVAADPAVFNGKPGSRIRLRIINAGSDTAYRVALAAHKLTITHTDGYPVQHQQVDALLIGMGERYDVLVTLGDGVFPLVALAEGKNQTGRALVRTSAGRAPVAGFRPAELNGLILTASRLNAADQARLAPSSVDVTHQVKITGGMDAYDWSINGSRFDMANPTAAPLLVRHGQRVRLDFVNDTTMWHPMHLHGHTYQLGDTGPRKDTAIVLPKTTLTVFFDADNPGQWLLHCHNAYHAEAGMMALVGYQQ